MTKLILIRGLPGSGKTNLAETIGMSLNCNWSHHEADHFFEGEEGVYRFDPEKLPEAHTQCLERTRKDLESGFTVIVSNTFTKREYLQPYFDLAAEFWITPVIYTCYNNFGTTHDVPVDIYLKMKAQFEHNVTFEQF